MCIYVIVVVIKLKGESKKPKRDILYLDVQSLLGSLSVSIIAYCTYIVNTYMRNDTITNTWLYMSFKHDITETLGDTVPYPHKHFVNKYDTVYCWLIDGFFGTKKGLGHLNDIIARFILTYPDSKYLKHFNDTTSTVTPSKLKAFYNLKSKVTKQKDYVRADVQFDTTFWVLKYYAEDLIREDGFIIYQKLEDYALENFIGGKADNSTLRAKSRSIYYWYEARDWAIGRADKKFETKEQWVASRKEHMTKINKDKAKDTDRKIQNCINGLLKIEYIKPSGKWNIAKICKDTGLHRNTVSNYLKKRNDDDS